jgi:hypothetical protein
MPIQSSLPEKTIRSSLKRSISATSPLNPIANMATQMRFFTGLDLVQHGRPLFAKDNGQTLGSAGHRTLDGCQVEGIPRGRRCIRECLDYYDSTKAVPRQ